MIVEIARTWINTPYHNQASLKGVGCDCFGLITGVYKDITGIEVKTKETYSSSWYKDHETKYKLKENLDQMGKQVLDLVSGDILIFAINEDHYVHCGIYAGNTFIHCIDDRAINRVVEMRYSDRWKERHRATYRYLWPL